MIITNEEIFDKLKAYKRKKSSFAFPYVRRVFPSLIASEIVSVQPMNLPTNLTFYLDNFNKNKDPE